MGFGPRRKVLKARRSNWLSLPEWWCGRYVRVLSPDTIAAHCGAGAGTGVSIDGQRHAAIVQRHGDVPVVVGGGTARHQGPMGISRRMG